MKETLQTDSAPDGSGGPGDAIGSGIATAQEKIGNAAEAAKQALADVKDKLAEVLPDLPELPDLPNVVGGGGEEQAVDFALAVVDVGGDVVLEAAGVVV